MKDDSSFKGLRFEKKLPTRQKKKKKTLKKSKKKKKKKNMPDELFELKTQVSFFFQKITKRILILSDHYHYHSFNIYFIIYFYLINFFRALF